MLQHRRAFGATPGRPPPTVQLHNGPPATSSTHHKRRPSKIPPRASRRTAGQRRPRCGRQPQNPPGVGHRMPPPQRSQSINPALASRALPPDKFVSYHGRLLSQAGFRPTRKPGPQPAASALSNTFISPYIHCQSLFPVGGVEAMTEGIRASEIWQFWHTPQR